MAVEVPLPDADGRARLLRLYGPGLDLPSEVVDEIVDQTEGTTASFMKELVRRTVLLAAEADETPGADHLRAAVAELLSSRDTLTRRLLGAADGGAAGGPPSAGPVPGRAGLGSAGFAPRPGPMPGVYKGIIG